MLQMLIWKGITLEGVIVCAVAQKIVKMDHCCMPFITFMKIL